MIETYKEYLHQSYIYELQTMIMFAVNHPRIFQKHIDTKGEELEEYRQVHDMVTELKKKYPNIAETYAEKLEKEYPYTDNRKS